MQIYHKHGISGTIHITYFCIINYTYDNNNDIKYKKQ